MNNTADLRLNYSTVRSTSMFFRANLLAALRCVILIPWDAMHTELRLRESLWKCLQS